MDITKSTPIQQLLFLYNLKNLALSKLLNVNNHSLDDIVKNLALTPSVDILKKLSNFLNVTIDLILNNSLENSVKLENKNLDKPIYVSFYEYIILRSRLIVHDKYQEGDTCIRHEISNNSLFIVLNNSVSRKLIFEEDDNIKFINPCYLIIFMPNDPTYFKKNKFSEYKEYLNDIIDLVYSPNYAEKKKIPTDSIFGKSLSEMIPALNNDEEVIQAFVKARKKRFKESDEEAIDNFFKIMEKKNE